MRTRRPPGVRHAKRSKSSRRGSRPSTSAIAWRAKVAAYLATTHEQRNVGETGDIASCVFDCGRGYVQFLAPANAHIVYAEAVPHAATLDPARTRILRELGFHRPLRHDRPNYWQKIPIRRNADLIRAARIAYRVFAAVYDVTDFSAVRSTLKIPEDDGE